MKILLGIIGGLCIVAAVLGGLYVALVICLVGGIIQIVHACQVVPIDAIDIAFGIVRILCASLAGWATFAVGVFLASGFFGAASSLSTRQWRKQNRAKFDR